MGVRDRPACGEFTTGSGDGSSGVSIQHCSISSHQIERLHPHGSDRNVAAQRLTHQKRFHHGLGKSGADPRFVLGIYDAARLGRRSVAARGRCECAEKQQKSICPMHFQKSTARQGQEFIDFIRARYGKKSVFLAHSRKKPES
mmetsp:Transcript_22177/g.42595  ORF Transcript_22177/g.42595 Transcript_22177/m.42595 type:complete len:143 (-) Transcript_22177:306-734(-)